VELAKKLGAGRPVYGLQAVAEGSEGNGHPPTLEELAARYVARVREVQPEGPWLLAGWSSGAVMAYEMARQIEIAGGTTSLLALFDPPPPLDRRSERADSAVLLARFAVLCGLAPREEPIREILDGLDLESGLDRQIERVQAEGMLPPDVSKPWVREHFDLYSRTATALHGYLPRPYGGEVTLFRAGASLGPGATDLTAGWGRLARTDTHLIPDADHFTLLQAPVLDRLVERLETALAAVDGEA
jgi:thioesterase domain-containing protein